MGNCRQSGELGFGDLVCEVPEQMRDAVGGCLFVSVCTRYMNNMCVSV